MTAKLIDEETKTWRGEQACRGLHSNSWEFSTGNLISRAHAPHHCAVLLMRKGGLAVTVPTTYADVTKWNLVSYW